MAFTSSHVLNQSARDAEISNQDASHSEGNNMETRNDKESTIEDQDHEGTMKDSIVDAPKGPPPGLSDGMRETITRTIESPNQVTTSKEPIFMDSTTDGAVTKVIAHFVGPPYRFLALVSSGRPVFGSRSVYGDEEINEEGNAEFDYGERRDLYHNLYGTRVLVDACCQLPDPFGMGQYWYVEALALRASSKWDAMMEDVRAMELGDPDYGVLELLDETEARLGWLATKQYLQLMGIPWYPRSSRAEHEGSWRATQVIKKSARTK